MLFHMVNASVRQIVVAKKIIEMYKYHLENVIFFIDIPTSCNFQNLLEEKVFNIF